MVKWLIRLVHDQSPRATDHIVRCFMSRRFEKEVGAAVVLLCVVVLGLGLALLGRAYTMPTHVDERKAHELTEIYEQGYYDMSPQEREQHANEIVGMRTAKWPLYNTGVCLCLVAATLAVPIVRFRLWDIRNLKT